MDKLPNEVRNSLVGFGLDHILAKREELVSLFKDNPCIPYSEDGRYLARPGDLINPKGAAAELFLPEDHRFPVGETYLTEDHVYVLEKLGMKSDMLAWKEICERAKSVESLTESCYGKALQRSRKLVHYLNKNIEKYIKDLSNLQEEAKAILEIRFLPFIKEPPKDYRNGLLWKGEQRKKEQFCSPKELFVPRYMDLVGSCCLILSTHETLGCGKLETNVKDVLGMLRHHPSCQQVIEQLDNTIQVWSKFNKEERETNQSKVSKICQCVYEYFEKYFTQALEQKDEGKDDGKWELLRELTKREWLFINETFVFSDQVAQHWHRRGAPYLYGLQTEFTNNHKNLLQATKVKTFFNPKDFLNAINSLKKSKGCTSLADEEFDVAVIFLNELKEVDENFVQENSGQIYLPNISKVLVKADELTINSTPWLKDRGDSHCVHQDITPDLAFKLGARSLLDKRLGKYSKTVGKPFGQHEELTDRLKNILKSYPCDSGILKELVQNADDAQATEIHFIHDKRTLPCEKVFQNNAKEIQGPALCVYNNRSFSEKDIEGIQKLGIGSKSDNAEKTGQFGVGFNAVYHLTDCPSFISNGDILCILDPHCLYAPGATYEHPGERFDPIDKEFQDDFPDVMKGYLEEFGFDLHGSTMFRLPLRTLETFKESKISHVDGVKAIDSLLRDFKCQAKRSMFFLNHIKKISICKISSDGKLTKVYEVTSKVEEEDLAKLETLHSHRKEFKGESTRNIPWHGVTFPIVLCDTTNCVEQWLVHQCFGVKDLESDEFPDGRDHKLLPHGGLAAFVYSNQRSYGSTEAPRYMAYCFLPLPIWTPLPVHVNGHFAVDSGRRELWKDTDSNNPLAQWNNMIKRNVIAPGYAALILEARNYMPRSDHEGEDETFCFFPDEISAKVGLFWYHKIFPCVKDDSWSPLTLAVYAFLANERKPVLPVVVAHEPKSNERPEDMPRRIRGWLPPQQVFFVNNDHNPRNLEVTDELIKIFLDIQLPVARRSPISIQQGFEKAGYAPRIVSPKSVVSALRTFSSTNPECKIGKLPCSVEASTFRKISELKELIIFCQKGENFHKCLIGLPLLLTADGILRLFSQEEKVFCSKFCDLFPKRAKKFVHPEIVTCLSHVMRLTVDRAEREPPMDTSTDATNNPTYPEVLLPLTADVVAKFMCDVFPEDTKDAKTHLDFDATGVPVDWLKKLWIYLQTYSKEVDDTEPPLDALKAWPILPTKSKKLVAVTMAKTVIDMTLFGSFSDRMKKAREVLEKLSCPCLDTAITLPERESQTWKDWLVSFVFRRSAAIVEPSEAVTKSYVAHLHNVFDVLNVFDFMIETDSFDAKELSDEDIKVILQFIQDGYDSLERKEDCNKILKRLPCYKAINGKHYKLSEFLEYAVIPASVPNEGIETVQEHTNCLFLHSDMLPTFKKLLTELNAGAKRSTAEFYTCYILPNFEFFSEEMRLTYLTHIRDDVIPSLTKGEGHTFLKHLKGARCIPNKDGEYVHASEFYDPRSKVFWIMEDESSNKFPPPPFNETEWLDFLIEIGMVKVVDEKLFIKFASRVACMGNSSPNDETCRERSKALLSFFFRHHHLHSPQFLENLSTVKFIASEKVEEVYLSLHSQHCCGENVDHQPFVQFSNTVPWKYRSLVWTSAHLLPNFPELSTVCCENPTCNGLYKHLQVKHPSPDMVISHLQNISQVLVKYSEKEQELPQNTKPAKIMDRIYKFLQKAAGCPNPDISAECSDICKKIGTRLSNTSCILVDDAKFVVTGNQLSFKIPEDKSLQPYIYEVPRHYGELVHLLKRLGATETVTPFQLANVFKEMQARIKDNLMDPELEKKAHNAMFLLFDSVLNEVKEENKQSSIINICELYLPSEDKRLMKSSELLCKIPPRHIKTIAKLSYHALSFFEKVGLQRELESKYLEALPSRLRPKPFGSVVEEKLDESCLEKTCKLCSEDNECDFIKKFSALLKSEQFKNGIIRLLKHQKKSGNLKPEEQQAASRFFSNKVEIKCMETVEVHLMLTDTKETVDGSSTSRNCYVVRQPDAWSLYLERGKVRGNLTKSINKILGWRIKEEFLIVVSDMLNCSISLEIPSVLNEHDIDVDAGRNEEVKLGSKVPVVFHQLLQQNPLFLFHIGELVAYCVDEDEEDGEFSPIKYILAKVLERVTSDSVEGPYDLKARYLIDIGNQKIEVSVLDLYKFCKDYPDKNSCTDLVLFTGDVEKLPESYEEAKREILEALRAAWRLPPDLRRKAIKRLYLRWHPDKNSNNKEFATEMMAFVSEQVQQMKNEEMELEEEPENYDEMFEQCDEQATQENATFLNFIESIPSGSIPFFCIIGDAATYTNPNPREARRWIKQAEGDLRLCRHSLRGTEPFHASACFMSQQIVEKSLKAALYKECGLTNDQLHSHNVNSLARNIQNLPRWRRMTNIDIVDFASVVALYYLPTRYPNQQPYPIVPFNAFDDKSENAIRSAEKIFQEVKRFIGS